MLILTPYLTFFLMSEMTGEWTIILKEMSFSRTHDQVLNTLTAFIGAIPLGMEFKFLCKIPGSDPSLLWGSEYYPADGKELEKKERNLCCSQAIVQRQTKSTFAQENHTSPRW